MIKQLAIAAIISVSNAPANAQEPDVGMVFDVAVNQVNPRVLVEPRPAATNRAAKPQPPQPLLSRQSQRMAEELQNRIEWQLQQSVGQDQQ